MTAELTSLRPRPGAAVFSYGFRPFFLGAAAWAVFAIVLLAGVMGGAWAMPAGVDALSWHTHEMVFGYTGGVIAGFLLTAIPNWTGRPPISGWPLAGLWGLWVLGRAAGLLPATLGTATIAAVDFLFLVVLVAVAWREVVKGANWRNTPVCALVTLFAAANAIAHAEILTAGFADVGPRLGLAVVAVLIALIGGRIVPNFTHNVLAKRGEARLPEPFGRFDRVCLAVTAAALALWVAWPHEAATGVGLIVAGAANGLRLIRWRGERVVAAPLLLVLHVGFLWLAVALVLMGLDRVVSGGLPLATLHALTAGAIGTMTLAVMTRASLGHTGRALVAGPWTTLIYVLVTVGAVLRVASPVLPTDYGSAIALASAVWAGAFLVFVLAYGPMLLRGRADAGGDP